MFKMYAKFFSIHLRSVMQYKMSFLLITLGQFLSAFSFFLGMFFLFQRFRALEGFSFEEVLLCYAIVMMGFALGECFARGFDTFSVQISNGEFDRMMLRPRSPIWQVLCSRIEFTRIGKVFQALIVFCYAIPTSGMDWTFLRIITLFLMILGGMALFSGLFLLYAALCFFTTEGLEVINIFTNGGCEFGSYPMYIYGKKILAFFTFVIPLACVQYYPLLYLLGRSDNLLFVLSPLASFIFLIPCYLIWRIGLRHYKSTGS